jgi:hypothetical protein
VQEFFTKQINSHDIINAQIQQMYLDEEFKILKNLYPYTNNFKLKLIFINGIAIHSFYNIDFTKFKELILDIDLTSKHDIIIQFQECKFNKISDFDNVSKNKFTNYELTFRFKYCSFEKESKIDLKTLYQQITNLEYNIKCEFYDYEKPKKDREKVSLNIYEDQAIIKIISNNIDIINTKIEGKCRIIGSSGTKISKTNFHKEIEIEDSKIEFESVNFLKEIKFKNVISGCFKNSTIENLVCSQGAKSIEFSNTTITDSTFNGEITDKAIFNNVTFIEPPEIGDIKFKNCNVEFSDVKFLDTHSPKAIAGFRALNKACRDANYHHGEIFFHGLELETRFNMLVERSYLFKSYILISYLFISFLFLKGFFSKNIKPVNSNNEVEKISNLSDGDSNIKVIQQDISKTYKKIYIKVINSIKNFLSIFLKKIFQLIANFIISFFFISNDGIERFLLCFHKLSSDFGRSLLLPLFWLVVFAIVVWNLSFIQINSSNNITENLIDKECESAKINVNELPKISKKITFKNSIGPLQLALPKQFISDDEIECYHHKANFFIDSLNFIHAVISYAIWFVWFFMIRARFRL